MRFIGKTEENKNTLCSSSCAVRMNDCRFRYVALQLRLYLSLAFIYEWMQGERNCICAAFNFQRLIRIFWLIIVITFICGGIFLRLMHLNSGKWTVSRLQDKWRSACKISVMILICMYRYIYVLSIYIYIHLFALIQRYICMLHRIMYAYTTCNNFINFCWNH